MPLAMRFIHGALREIQRRQAAVYGNPSKRSPRRHRTAVCRQEGIDRLFGWGFWVMQRDFTRHQRVLIASRFGIDDINNRFLARRRRFQCGRWRRRRPSR